MRTSMKKLLFLPLLFALIATACSDDDLPNDDPTNGTLYSLTVTASEGGSASAELSGYHAGKEVTVTAVPNDGYYFVEWLEDGTSVSSDPVYRFQMPERDVALHATFAEIPSEPISNDYRVAVGANYTLLLDENGYLSAFGLNEHGQLGDGTTENRLNPVAILPQTRFAGVFCGGSSSYAIDREGNLYAWGNNENGRLGDGSTTDRHVPTQIMSGTRFSQVAPGSEHTLAIDSEGGLWAFGSNEHGQLGDGSTTDRHAPVRIAGDRQFGHISAGGWFSFAIDTENRLWAFGWNNHGQLGDGTTTEQHSPVQVMPERRFRRISAGNYHTLALDFNNKLWGFGMNMTGQLGDAQRQDKIVPVEIMGDRDFTDIAAKGTHSLALDSEGNLWAFGMNSYGQLGDGTNTNKTTPVQIGAGTTFGHIYTGWYHTAATDNTGNIWMWGSNRYGQLGDGTTTNRNVPALFDNGQGGTDSRSLVVYYSWSGNSESLASEVAGILGCNTVEVELTTPYAATSDQELYPIAQAEIAAIDNEGRYPSIRTTVSDMDKYDNIIICYPLWYSRMATPMQSFLHNHAAQLAGKTLALICTSASSGISQTVADARRLCPDSTIPEALWIRASSVGSARANIEQWLSDIGISK